MQTLQEIGRNISHVRTQFDLASVRAWFVAIEGLPQSLMTIMMLRTGRRNEQLELNRCRLSVKLRLSLALRMQGNPQIQMVFPSAHLVLIILSLADITQYFFPQGGGA